MRIFYKNLLVMVLVLAATSVLAAQPGATINGKITEIEWEDLMPPMPEGDTLSLKDLSSEDWLGPQVNAPDDGSDVTDMSDPRDPKTQMAHQGNIRPAQENAPVVKKYDGKKIKLAGYIIPLDFEATKVRKFLLVPYIGACIHVPPPPTNQVVYVESMKAIAVSGLFDPVYITGKMSLVSSKTVLAEAGYRIDATEIVPYE